MPNPIQGLSNLFIIENSDSNSGVLGGTGKELVVEKTAVTLSSNAATISTRFAPGATVYVIPAYEFTVESDGTIDLDFSALPDTSVQVLTLGKESQLAGTD